MSNKFQLHQANDECDNDSDQECFYDGMDPTIVRTWRRAVAMPRHFHRTLTRVVVIHHTLTRVVVIYRTQTRVVFIHRTLTRVIVIHHVFLRYLWQYNCFRGNWSASFNGFHDISSHSVIALDAWAHVFIFSSYTGFLALRNFFFSLRISMRLFQIQDLNWSLGQELHFETRQ